MDTGKQLLYWNQILQCIQLSCDITQDLLNQENTEVLMEYGIQKVMPPSGLHLQLLLQETDMILRHKTTVYTILELAAVQTVQVVLH